MKRFLLRLLLLVSITITGIPAGSFALGQTAAQRVETEENFAAAETAYRNGDLSLALSRFRSFVLRHHNSTLAPNAYTYLGRIFLRQKRYADALLYLERVSPPERSAEVRLLIGYSLIMSGENEQGLTLLQPLVNLTFSPVDQQYLFEALALAHQRQEEPLRALYFYHLALPGTKDRQALLQTVHKILVDQSDKSLLTETAFMFNGDPIGQDARLQLARKSLADRDQQQALQQLQLILASDVSFPWRNEAAQLMDRFSQGSWLQHDAIGVLLPMSGRYAPFGKSLYNISLDKIPYCGVKKWINRL